jgi:hypothetical protein
VTSNIGPGRYHVILTLADRPALHGWWAEEATARRKVTSIARQHGQPGARVTLTDEETGSTLTTWPDEA